MSFLHEIFFVVQVFIRITSCFTLHSTSACIEKNFPAFGYNLTDESDFPLQTDSAECGEDGFFITQNAHLRFLTVADGAGGWKHYGVKPKYFVDELLGLIEKKLAYLSFKHVQNHDNKRTKIIRDIVTKSLEFLLIHKKTGIASIGSCTIASISVNLKTLHANSYYLGDAGFLIIRDGKIFHQTIDQSHKYLNSPYLIGNAGDYVHPSYGISKQFQLKTHDIFVISSDGLLGNLFHDQILEIVNQESYFELKNEISCDYLNIAKKIAKHLTVKAKKIGESRFNVWTPYAQEIYEIKNLIKKKGKKDDTTVIVGIISA